MSIQDDWLLQQIQQTITLVIGLATGSNAETTEETDVCKKLCQELTALIEQGRLSDAEDALFDGIDPDDSAYLMTGLEFYSRLNGFSDKELDRHGFPRPEIVDGLHSLLDIYGMQVPIE